MDGMRIFTKAGSRSEVPAKNNRAARLASDISQAVRQLALQLDEIQADYKAQSQELAKMKQELEQFKRESAQAANVSVLKKKKKKNGRKNFSKSKNKTPPFFNPPRNTTKNFS